MAAGGTVAHIHRLQAVWTRAGGDDVGVTTHDFRQVDSVFPDAGGVGDTHNYAQMEADFIAFWAAIKGQYPAGTFPAELRWYRNDDPVPEWGEPARVTTLTPVAGTAASAIVLPGQVASSVTERVDSRRHWGRFYLPGLSGTALTSGGRWTSGAVTVIANAAQTLYNAWNSRGMKCAVLGSVKTDYNTSLLVPTSWIGGQFGKWIAKGEQQQRIMIAYDVKTVRCDDVPDVIRRRRVAPALTRLDRTIT